MTTIANTTADLKVKDQILAAVPEMEAVPKCADLVGDVGDVAYRIFIKKNQVTKVTAGGVSVWTPDSQSDIDIIEWVTKVFHPEETATEEPEVQEASSSFDPEDIVEESDKTEESEEFDPTKTIGEDMEEKTTAGTVADLVNPAPVKKAEPKKVEEPKETVVVDDAWITKMGEFATELCTTEGILLEGHNVRFRPAKSNGKYVTSYIDLYLGDEKLATAGLHHRVGFATKGYTDNWKTRVTTGVKEIYRKIGGAASVQHHGTATIQYTAERIVGASGNINDVLAAIEAVKTSK